ncbi:hypothetical protein [Brasilonema sp. UFV-L1]|uniref:hypothetical protein n=1 Tax=Brasilonema sp. UFV-L1 TaxID=2234130 RepID=UPI00145CEF78|nr:hypothetical protein [Brasilonema sp. UFV-L1]
MTTPKKQTEFLIEKMQPTWLENTRHKWLYRVAVGLISGLIFGLISGLKTDIKNRKIPNQGV